MKQYPIAQDPPEKRKPYNKWTAILTKLESMKPVWYLIGEFENESAGGSSCHHCRARFPHFDFRSTSEDGKGSKLYAKLKEVK